MTLNEKPVAIVQARMGSTRLPGKSMKKIGEKTLLSLVLDRLKESDMLSNIVVATTNRSEDNVLVFESKKATQREKKVIKTHLAHLKNMITGVKEGTSYKLKICSGHFPMSVSVKGNVFEIKNFIGETVPRTLALPEGVTVKIEGQFITVEGIDKELTGQTAALIEKLTRRPGFDKRVFQDGIFIVERSGRPLK